MNDQIGKSSSYWNYTLNTFKAILILLVVLIHLMSGEQGVTKIVKGILLTTVMPLYFGISGYLIKETLFEGKFFQLLNKYFFRLLIPFILAYLVYSLIKLSFINLLYTDNHLWFIPAFLMMIFYVFIIEKLNIDRLFILMITITFYITWLTFIAPGSGIDTAYYIGDKRYYYFFVFFYLGYMIRNNPGIVKISRVLCLIMLITSGYALFVVNDSAENIVYSVSSLFFNLSLILLVVSFTQKFTNIKIPILSDLGSFTLPIYLWHILPLYVMWYIRDNYGFNGIVYLISYFILLILMIYLIIKSKNTLFTRVFLTGMYK